MLSSDAYRGQLSGKIVLVSLPGTGDEPTRAPFRRLSSSDISDRDEYELPTYDPDAVQRRIDRGNFALQLDAFLASEGAVAWAKKSYRDGKLLHGSGYTHRTGEAPALPVLELAAEDYRKLTHLARTGAENGGAPRLSINTRVSFTDDDTQAYNIIGEILGSDPSAGYVMAGAHFDSWAMARLIMARGW